MSGHEQKQGRLAPIDLRADPPLALSFLPGSGDTLVVSLAGVGTQRSVQPPAEFFRMSSQSGRNHVLFVSDASRSWLNGPGLADRIVAAIEAAVVDHGIRRIVALGNSMGGTMALLLASLTRIDAAIAVVPQVSVHPDRVPEERRWMFFRKKIAEWPFVAVEKLATENTEMTILHGGSDDEIVHLDRFPRDAKARHFVFPSLDHNLAKSLRKSGMLEKIIGRAIEGKPWQLRRSIEKAGGITREAFDAQRNDFSTREMTHDQV